MQNQKAKRTNRILDENLKEQYELEIIGIYKDIEPAKQNHIIYSYTT